MYCYYYYCYVSSGLRLVRWLQKIENFLLIILSRILLFPVQSVSSSVATSSQTTPKGKGSFIFLNQN